MSCKKRRLRQTFLDECAVITANLVDLCLVRKWIYSRKEGNPLYMWVVKSVVNKNHGKRRTERLAVVKRSNCGPGWPPLSVWKSNENILSKWTYVTLICFLPSLRCSDMWLLSATTDPHISPLYSAPLLEIWSSSSTCWRWTEKGGLRRSSILFGLKWSLWRLVGRPFSLPFSLQAWLTIDAAFIETKPPSSAMMGSSEPSHAACYQYLDINHEPWWW